MYVFGLRYFAIGNRPSFFHAPSSFWSKTYIHCNEDYTVYTEELVHKDGTHETVPEGLKCAGMPENIKMSLINHGGSYAWDNFFIGNKFEGKKTQVRVPGGLIIRETTYELKEQIFRSGLL